MIVLDTNVLSALMHAELDPEVATWLDRHPEHDLFTTSVSEAEILAGIAILPDGRRRRALVDAAEALFADDFEGRVLAFDSEAAVAYAEMFAERRRVGRRSATLDLMIGAIARRHGAAVATRDTGGFEDCGLTLVNPWSQAKT